MAYRILIVDDDQEFNLLLTDVFTQADYEVETCGDVTGALPRLAEGGIDLLVTDFRMPGPTGLELVKRARESNPRLPIIMVSGYLENGMIRDLIRYGVGGIFMKPLNIFSLLKKTEELIERGEKEEADSAGQPTTGFGANIGFPFRAFPCRDARSREFAKQLYNVRDFPKNLLLISEAGMDLRTVCEDLVAIGEYCPRVVFFDPDDFDVASARAVFDGEGAASTAGATIVFYRAESLNPTQRSLIYAMARKQGGFATNLCARRFIFCLDRELDDYYDEGLIDEEFYLFLGTTELRVPSLREIPEDLPVIAETLMSRDCPGKELEGAARAFLQRHEWRGNLEEFRDKLRLAARLCADPIVSVDQLRQVVEGPPEPSEDASIEEDESTSPLEHYLRVRRSDYLGAYQRLLGRPPAESVSPSAPVS